MDKSQGRISRPETAAGETPVQTAQLTTTSGHRGL